MEGKDSLANDYRKKAEKRRVAIDKYCWNSKLNYYCDYNFKTQRILNEVTPAGMYPFCFFESKPDYLSLQARKASEAIKTKLLQAGWRNNNRKKYKSTMGFTKWMGSFAMDDHLGA